MECSIYSYVQIMKMSVKAFHILQNTDKKECVSWP